MAGTQWAHTVGVGLLMVVTFSTIIFKNEVFAVPVSPDNTAVIGDLPPSLSQQLWSETNRDDVVVNKKCPSQCSCSAKHVECTILQQSSSSFGISALPNVPSVATSLSLSGYNLQNVGLYFYLNQMDNLHLLKIHKSNLRTIPSIPALQHLHHLDLSDNFITSPNSDVANLRLTSITHLNISGNSIEKLEKGSFRNFPFLKVLDLSRNPITVVVSNAFKLTSDLIDLNLSFTNLTTINSHWIKNLPYLQRLNVSHSEIQEIHPVIISTSLEILDVSYNQLNEFPIMRNLSNLLELYIHHTNINETTKLRTKGGINLKVLDMKETRVEDLKEGISNLKSLEDLDISNSKLLKHIRSNSLAGLEKLSRLVLNDCPKLYDIENLAFIHLYKLKVLDLRSTALKVLPNSIRTLTNLTTFRLDNTALLCDCHAYAIPKWLISTANASWTGVNPLQCSDGVHRMHSQLVEHHENLGCEEIEIHTPSNEWIHVIWGQSALLECNVTGDPEPLIIWQSSQQKLYIYRDNSTYQEGWPWFGQKIQDAVSKAVTSDEEIQVLQSGHLLVNKLSMATIGRYKCVAINAVSHQSIQSFVGIDDAAMRSLVLESFLFGISCATLFLLITLIVQFIRYLVERLDCECCCCCKGRLSPKTEQVRKLLESVETYKSQQLEKLRENYNYQVVGIKDSCYQQMEKLRDSYAHQSRNLKDLRDYSANSMHGVRDQYVDQLNKICDYSTGQMNRVRENYVFQRHKIRKFSAHQLVKLRETYKYQQKTLNKVLENLPDLYLQNCRTGGCQTSDSLLFDNELQGIDAYYKLDFLEVQSYEGSDYYTPNSTLTRPTRRSDGKKRHSRNSSEGSSTIFQEAQSWITRRDSSSTTGVHSPDKTRNHTRSLSVTSPPSEQKSKPGHRRSLSACLTKPKSSPVCSRPALMEEAGDETSESMAETPMFSCAPSLTNSPLHTPYDTPYHCQTAPTTPSHVQVKVLPSILAPIHNLIKEKRRSTKDPKTENINMTKSESTDAYFDMNSEHSSNNISDIDIEDASFNKDTITEMLTDDNLSVSEMPEALEVVCVPFNKDNSDTKYTCKF